MTALPIALSIVSSFFSIIGVLYTGLSIIAVTFEQTEIFKVFTCIWIYVPVLIISLCYTWFSEYRTISGILEDRDIKIKIRFGNIFCKNSNLFIPVNTQFRSVFSSNYALSPKSIHGQVVQKSYNGDPARLENQLKALLHTGFGSQDAYPVGSTVFDEVGKYRYYFVATADIDDKAVSYTDEDMIINALENFWCFLDTNASNDLPIMLPLLGCGQGRMTIKQDQIIRTIILSFITHVRRIDRSSIRELIICVPYKSLLENKVDIKKLQQLIGYICSEPRPDKQFSSRGIGI